MKIHNHLPLLIDCLSRWKNIPTEKQFTHEYAAPLAETTSDFFEDYHDVLTHLDWAEYRNHALKIDPAAEEIRLRKHIKDVESLFGFNLEGETFLIGSFHGMDGYARFDRGTHKVYLGVDENFHRPYLDILMVHELTHVARESRPEVWEGFGLNPKMTQAEFTENQPVIEHLMGEGFSCAVSEILVPGEPAWEYCYLSESSLQLIHHHRTSLNKIITDELKKPDGDYGRYYGISPSFAHYYWAWQWVKTLIRDQVGGDARKLVSRCSQDFYTHALTFKI